MSNPSSVYVEFDAAKIIFLELKLFLKFVLNNLIINDFDMKYYILSYFEIKHKLKE